MSDGGCGDNIWIQVVKKKKKKSNASKIYESMKNLPF